MVSKRVTGTTGLPHKLGPMPGSEKRGRLVKEKVIEVILLIMASCSVVVVGLIVIFIFTQGYPILRDAGILSFVTGTRWDPAAIEPSYGILPMIIGSSLATLGALAMGVPLGLACAVFMAEIAPKRAASLLRSAVELLAGIPSVVYGFFGIMVIVPLIRDNFNSMMGGYSILAGSIVLAVMILPTVINISEDSIRAVPRIYKEGSLALGATHWQTITKVILPAAKSGIVAAVVLAMGRAIGETMAVIMVMGGVKAMPGAYLPDSLLKPLLVFLEPGRTMTATIAMEMGYADPVHKRALFAIGIVLFIVVFTLNMIVNLVIKGKRSRT